MSDSVVTHILEIANTRHGPAADLEERPFLLRGASSATFDSEGVATRERKIVDAGILTSYVLGSYSARRLGLQTTANAGGVRNLLLPPGGEASENLMGAVERGLYVTDVMGQGVNLITGDYSRGASGFLIEKGRIVHPVEEVTIAGNLRDMFAGLVAAGRDLECRGSVRTGSWLLDSMMIAGE